MNNGFINTNIYMPYPSMSPYGTGTVDSAGMPAAEDTAIDASGQSAKTGECQTCANRKYMDGSDEMVSFKSAQHISPESAASRVRAHEMEHVSNAYKKAATGNGKVLHATVSLKTAICPECGRAYVAGGVTNTKIKYSNEESPYVKNLKKFQEDAMKGNSVDLKIG